MPCLDENLLVAFAEGCLGDGERRSVESHVASCPDCAELVAIAAGGNPPALAPPGAREAHAGLARGAGVGRYVILDLVGRGGMGEVYAAYDPQLDRKVALKLLHEHMREGSGRARLLREAKAIARLSHPNVVVVHDAGAIVDAHGERVFVAMEFIEGGTLAAWLAASPRAWPEIRDAFAAAGEGLAAAHDAGLVHRDFKPQNVMVARDGAPRVMDFGLASAGAKDDGSDDVPIDVATLDGAASTTQSVALTRTGALMGTPLYMAPEQFLGRATDARTDQFSFCVALYEALFGERPFPSESLPALLESVVAGRVREPPHKARVPGFLRKLVLRGLAADPAHRFPSMRALLEALRHDPGRRRRTLALAAGGLALAALAIGGTQRWATRGARMCRAAGDRLASAWGGGSNGGRRDDVHRAFLATGRSFAEDTWTRVTGILDDYARGWTRMYTDACEATHVRGDQSAEVLDLRMTCLEQRRGALDALTDVLAHADGAVVVQAVNAAQALPGINACGDVTTLRSAVPPPRDAAARTRVEALRAELAEVKALTDTGQWPAAGRKLPSLVAAARELGYAPLLVEVLAARGWLEEQSGDAAAALATQQETLWSALAARRDDVALESAALLTGIAGYRLGRFEDAQRWDRLGQALLERLGPGHERAAAWLSQNRGVTRLRRGDNRAALVDLRAALALKQRVLPADHPDFGLSWSSIGLVLTELGDYPAALEALDKFLENHRHAYGPDSPLLANPLANRGEVLGLVGRHREAERDLRDAIERWKAQVGLDHPFTAYAETALGKTLITEGRAEDAVPVLRAALATRERAEPNRELAAETRFALARALWDAGRDRKDAIALATSAREVYRKLPGQEKHVAEVDVWLGTVARR